MIDFKQELKHYTQLDLERLLKTNLNMPDNYKNSIMLYNKAIDNVRIKSEDIAIIELKKAISLNPDFCEAINMLGVLYAGMGEFAKARDCFDKVIGKDTNNSKALEYIISLDPNYNKSGNVNGKQKDKIVNKKSVNGNRKRNARTDSTSVKPLLSISDLLKKDLAKYIIGFIAGILVFSLINMLLDSREEVVDTSNIIEDVNLNENKEDFKQKYNDLNEVHKALLGQLKALEKTSENYANLSKLLEIDKQVSSGKYVVAADMLVALSDTELDGVEKEKYESIRTQTMDKAAQEIFIQGRDLYKKKQFEEALEKFNKSIAYSNEGKNLNAIIYYRGVCYLELNNRDKALEAFNEVITKYPSSSYAKYSKSRRDSINSES